MTSLLHTFNSNNSLEHNTSSTRYCRPMDSNRMIYVDALVDVNALVIESIWQIPTNTNTSVVPLRTFIQEVLKRSRTTYSTLQTALFYLFRSRPEINNYLSRMQSNSWEYAYVSCGRRMFLASLIVASKFVQDKTYRNSAWAKIAGLPVSEVNAAERIFLKMIDYHLFISQHHFEQWHHLLHLYVEAKTQNQPTSLQDLNGIPFNNTTEKSPIMTPIQVPSPRTPRSNQHHGGWTLVLSPTTLQPHPYECRTKKRKLSNSINQPQLSLSAPSSINSSPMQTPTQISPIRHTPPALSWETEQQRSSKKRKFTLERPSYNLSHVRQDNGRFQL